MKQIECQVVGDYYCQPSLRELAKAVKQGDGEAMHKAAQMMAPMVKPDDILVPIPGHTGKAVQMLSLSKELALLTGAKIADVIEGHKRESSYNLKLKGVVQRASEMGFRLTQPIPQGRRVWLVDNVVASGNTALAALTLIPQAQVLALAIDNQAIGRLPGINVNYYSIENNNYQQMNMEKTYYVEASRHIKDEYRVECDEFRNENVGYKQPKLQAYERMVAWMKQRLAENDGKPLEPEWREGQHMCVVGHERTVSPPMYRVLDDSEVVYSAQQPFEESVPHIPYEAKGYDLGEDAYFFATVDSRRTVKPYKAESPEAALAMAKGDQLHNVLVRVEPVRQYLHADKEHKVTLEDGTTVDIIGEADLLKKLLERFPDGLTVRLADENFQNLLEYKQKTGDITEELSDWMGLINPGNTHMLVAHGALPAELHLKPEDYKYIYACDKTYFDEDLYDLIQDENIVASSLLMAEEGMELDAARVIILKSMIPEDRLQVCGKPFHEIMELAQQNGVANDTDLLYHLDRQYMEQQPKWLQDMAHEATKDSRHKYWVEKVAPVNAAYYKAYDDAVRQAAEVTGFSSADELKKAFETKPYAPEMIERLTKANQIIREAHDPALERAADANLSFSRLKVTNEADFIRRFDAFCKKNVKEIAVGQNKLGEWSVRCRIADEQQMRKMLLPEDSKFKHKAGEVKQLAYKYFADEIKDAMSQGQQQSRGLTR